jgi:hypothetical protein
MYKVIEELQGVREIVVVDLTSGLGTKAYHDGNTKFLTIDDKTEVSCQSDPWKPLRDIVADDEIGYQNVEVRNPAWPSEMMIFQDYGNHEGGSAALSFDERVLFPCLALGSESVGYFDGAISVMYRVSDRLFVFKVCIDPVKPRIYKIRQKRPTNIDYAVTGEGPDAKLLVSVLFSYQDEEPKWKEIMIPGMTVWDIHKPAWIKWIMSNI